MINYKKVADKVFALKSNDNYYMVYTYPVQVFKLDVVSMEEAEEFIHLYLADSEMVFNERDLDFHNFFSLDWLITSDCNLNCSHCFARKPGEKFRYGLAQKSMSKEEIDLSISFALEKLGESISPDADYAKIELFIIGGEPLIEKELIQYGITRLDKSFKLFCSKRNIQSYERQTMIVTNGICIDKPFAQYCAENNIGLTISVDAPGYSQKIDKDGLSYTPKVIDNIRTLLECGVKNVACNFVIPPNKLDDTDIVFDYLKQCGILDKLTTVQMSPQIPPTRQTKFCGCNSSEVVISDFGSDLAMCEKFAEKMLGYNKKYDIDIKEYHKKMHSLLSMGGIAYRCPAAQWKICVVPGGDIYPCHQLVNIDGFCLGNVHSDTNQIYCGDIYKMFRERTVFKVSPCKDCILQTSCITFVDCPARCYLECGDINKVPKHYCLIAKKYLESIFEDFIDEIESES